MSTLELAEHSSGAFGTGPFTTSSFTPQAGSLLVFVSLMGDGSTSGDATGSLALTDTQSLTWTKITTAFSDNGWDKSAALFIATGVANSSMTIDVDCDIDVYTYGVTVLSFPGSITTPTNFEESIAVCTDNTAYTVTLPSTPDSASELLGFIYIDNDNNDFTPVAASGFTVIDTSQAQYGNAGGDNLMQSITRTSTTSPDVGWSDPNVSAALIAMAVEVVVDIGPHVFFDITDLPSDFGNAETADIIVRTRGVDIGATPLKLYAQLFQSDETTSLSDEVEVAEETADSSFSNTTTTFTGLNTIANKSVWDNARVRFRWGT